MLAVRVERMAKMMVGEWILVSIGALFLLLIIWGGYRENSRKYKERQIFEAHGRISDHCAREGDYELVNSERRE